MPSPLGPSVVVETRTRTTTVRLHEWCGALGTKKHGQIIGVWDRGLELHVVDVLNDVLRIEEVRNRRTKLQGANLQLARPVDVHIDICEVRRAGLVLPRLARV